MGKKHSNNTLTQQIGNNILEKTLLDISATSDLFWKLRNVEDQLDKGIDYECEIEDKESGETQIIFKIQNKGTNNELKPLKRSPNKGFIPFQFKIRNINYYRRELNIAVAITVCCIKTKKVYWHSIQLDNDVDERVQKAKQEGKKTLQIYIDPRNVLNLENSSRFLKDIYESNDEQNIRRLNRMWNKFDADYSDKPILDALYLLFTEKYADLNIIPTHFLLNNHPFKIGKSFYPLYSSFTVLTNNKELFELFSTLEIKDGAYIVNDKFSKDVDESPEKAKYIVNKLTDHGVFYFQLDSSLEVASIKLLEKTECSCIKCTYHRLLYKNVLNLVNDTPESIDDKMLEAYMQYELGNYIKSAKLFLEIWKISKREKRHILKIITQFNLVELRHSVRMNDYGINKEKKLIEKLDDIRKSLHKSNSKNEIEDWILNYKFHTIKRIEIGQIVNKIRDHYYLQLRGGWSHNSNISILLNKYAEFVMFIKGNFIIYDMFAEFAEVNDLFIEGLIISHAIKEEESSRLEYFNDWHFMQIVFNGNAENLLKHFNRYRLKSLKYQSTAENGFSFLEVAKNHLTKNFNLISAFSDKKESGNIDFWKKHNNIFCNILTLLSISEFSSSQIIPVAKDLVQYLKNPEVVHYSSFKYIKLFIKRNSNFLDNSILENFLNIFISNEEYHSNELFDGIISIYLERKMTIDDSTADNLIDIAFTSEYWKNFDFIFKTYHIVSTTSKEKINYKIKGVLNAKFSSYFYYDAAINDIFDENDNYFEEFVNSTASHYLRPSFKSVITKKNDNRYSNVNRLLNLCFKRKIDLSQERFDTFRNINEYYAWLFDMGGFDYSNFNPKWAVEYQSQYFIREYKKYPIIKEKIAEYLKDDFHSMLEELFIRLSI